MTSEQQRRRAYKGGGGGNKLIYRKNKIRSQAFASRFNKQGSDQDGGDSVIKGSKEKVKSPAVNTGSERNVENKSEYDNDTKGISGPKVEQVCDDENDEKVVLAAKPYSLLMNKLALTANITKRQKISQSTYLGQPGNICSLNDVLRFNNDQESKEDSEIENFELSDSEDGDNEAQTNTSDPFVSHFTFTSASKENQLSKILENDQKFNQKILIPELGKIIITLPKETSNHFHFQPIVSAEDMKLKKKLFDEFSRQRPKLEILEKYLSPLIFNYQDVLFCERTPLNSEILRRLVCLHCLNHILKTRDRIIKNNAKLARETVNCDLDLRDQGFTRPKILLLLPTRQSCVRFVQMIISLFQPEQQENRKRFEDSYVEKFENQLDYQTDDFWELFGGNNDDMFRLGLKFTRKTLKYFSQFYNSDIIVASPLGLRMAMMGKNGKKNDTDFLSSIELVIVEQGDALLMQNWEHMEYIFNHLNLQPKETHGCDFSRVRSWYLDDNAKYLRQTITLTAFNTPEINTLLFNKSKNLAGKAKITASYNGIIHDLRFKIKQVFSRLESTPFTADPDVRFTYFTTTVIPSLTRHINEIKGTLIFVPSYLDFVRIRNYFSMSQATTNLSFGSISEYSSVREVTRTRSYFFTERLSILIYTERVHHFRRYRIRGVRRVIMYGLPDNPIFYREIVEGFLGRSLQDGRLISGEGSVRVIFSKWDALKLERIVGLSRLGTMIREKRDNFEFL